MSNHKHGTMEIEAQKHTYQGFIKICIYGAILTAVILSFLAIFNT